jgi:hypothetical protein
VTWHAPRPRHTAILFGTRFAEAVSTPSPLAGKAGMGEDGRPPRATSAHPHPDPPPSRGKGQAEHGEKPDDKICAERYWTHRPRGRAQDGVGEALVRRDGPRGNTPGRPDKLRGGACGTRVCGLATGCGHSSLSSPSALLSLWLLSPVSALWRLASPPLPVVRWVLLFRHEGRKGLGDEQNAIRLAAPARGTVPGGGRGRHRGGRRGSR